MYHFFLIYIFFLINSLHLGAQQNCALKISEPSCERLSNPIGVELLKPSLGWQLNANCDNQWQSAYHILVASTREKLNQNIADVWDSKKVIGSNSINILFGGKTLKTAQTYYWKVRVWNALNEASNWSTTQQWTMGLVNNDKKQALWIGSNLDLDSASQKQKNATGGRQRRGPQRKNTK